MTVREEWVQVQTDSGITMLDESEVCAITLDIEKGAGTSYSIHMKSGSIFTTRSLYGRLGSIPLPTKKHPVMK